MFLESNANTYSRYGIGYFISVFLSLFLIILPLILIHKYLKDDKKIDKLIFICSIVWLVFGIVNRISEAVDYICIYPGSKPDYTWKYLVPTSFCSVISIITPIILILKHFNIVKGDSLHALVYMGYTGAAVTYAYPQWLSIIPAYAFSSIMAWLHHSMIVFMFTLLIIKKRFVPSAKKYYVLPLVYSIFIIYGLFLISAFGYSNAFAIEESLISSNSFLKVITSWYGIMIISFILLLGFLFIYEKVKNKITVKEFFLQVLRIHK